VDISVGTAQTIAALVPAPSYAGGGDIVQTAINPGQVAWNPTLSRAIIAVGNGLCSDLGTLTRQGVSEFNVVVEDGDHSWRLDDGLHHPASEPCTQGRAAGPAWSPDGQQIAFLASPQSVGVHGVARQNVPWNLYLMPASGGKPRVLLSNISYATDVAWSPAGDRIAVTGGLHGAGQGLSVVDPQGRNVRKVTTQEAVDISWTPDGKSIIALVEAQSDEPPFLTRSVKVFGVAS
jgi:WD40 repeat protein